LDNLLTLSVGNAKGVSTTSTTTDEKKTDSSAVSKDASKKEETKKDDGKKGKLGQICSFNTLNKGCDANLCCSKYKELDWAGVKGWKNLDKES